MPADLRPYPLRHSLSLVLDIKRGLLPALAKVDAVGGDAVTARTFGLPALHLLRHPDLVRAVLVDRNADVTKARGLRLAATVLGRGLLTSEPPQHTRARRLVLPAFHHARLRAYGREMTALAAAEAERWTAGEPFDLAASMNRLALAIAGRTLFGADTAGVGGRVAAALDNAFAGFDAAQFPFADKLTWLPTRANRRTRRARAVLDRLVYGLIRQRRAAGTAGREDLLSLLLDARDEDTGEAMTDEEVRDEALTLLLAGHETTAVGLAWTWALLAGAPDAEAALHAEADALGADPTFDSLRQLAVARATFAEGLRLRPPAWVVGRQAACDTDLGGLAVRRGDTVLFAPLFLHRDPRFWEAPERFDPGRFAPDRARDRHKFAYVPFSAGRRGCIGEQFAWAEGTLVLSVIARRWRLRLAGPAPEPHGSVTLRPGGPVWTVAERRG